jgi:hypothetical protein
LPPILALSVGVVITQTFDTNTSERLGWLETILTIVNFDVRMPTQLKVTSG